MGAVVTVEADPLDRACEFMHDAYERAAVDAGWQTQPRSRVPWAEVPAANKAAMRAAVGALLGRIEEYEGKVSGYFADAFASEVVEHRLVFEDSPARCSCGGWEPKLGESIFRGFDRHVLEAT